MTGIAAETERTLRADARRNRERILQSARVVFAEAGAKAQMEDVARHAGVGVGTVYRHFPTKDALMVELVRQKLALLRANSERALEREDEPFDALADYLRESAAAMARDAALQHAVMGAGEHIWEQAEPERDELRAIMAELIERAQRTGELRADTTADDIPMLMCGVCATMTHSGPGFDWRRHLEFVIDGLRA